MNDARTQATPPSGELLAPTRILVIDDDEVDRERVRRLLPRADVEATVLEEEDPIQALSGLKRTAPDLVLLDYNFPRHDGLTVLRDLRDIDPLVPVIVLTGFDDTALAVELMKAGAVDYIPKSGLTVQRLGQSIRHALRLRASEFAARAAQEALRVSEEFNRRILEASIDCIKVLALDGSLLSMSAGGQRTMGIADFSRLRGRPYLSFFGEEHRPLAEAALDDARAGGTGRFVGFCPAEDGRPLFWDVLVTPMYGPDGKPERLLAVSRDVTEQRRQAEFEQQLLGIVSHDLRNPISAMMMGGTLLLDALDSDEKLAKVARRIVTSGKRATRLIRDLLDFTQVRLGGGIPIERKDSDIHAVCRQAVEEIALNYPERTVVHTSEGDGQGAWDADRIAQVVGNLTHNAISYSPPDTPVSVRSWEDGAFVRIEVHNGGEPIAADVVPTLFQPFKRGARRHDPERSIGLGLFIVREIVTAHGGSVTLSSTRDEGTRFRVTLPRS